MAIHVVQPNPAMDRIEVLEQFEVGTVNRSIEVRIVAGGKGLNVARGIRRLGHDVAAYGFLGGLIGDFIHTSCVELGIADRHVAIAGETRVCFILVDRSTGRSTVINEPGPMISAADQRQLHSSIVSRCRPADLVVLAGSLPPGVGADFYPRLVVDIQKAGARAIVDTSGEALAAAVEARPWMVKANVRELNEAGVGIEKGQVAGPLGGGTDWIVATRGSLGATVVSSEGVWELTVPEVRVVNATGSGDAFLAGLVSKLDESTSVREALLFGAACAVGSVLSIGPDVPDEGTVRALLGSIQLSEH